MYAMATWQMVARGCNGVIFWHCENHIAGTNKLTSWSLTQSYSSFWLWLRYSLTIQITTDLRGLYHNACCIIGQIVWRWSINIDKHTTGTETSSSSSVPTFLNLEVEVYIYYSWEIQMVTSPIAKHPTTLFWYNACELHFLKANHYG